MNCPYCNSSIGSDNTCTCGEDISILVKAKKLSNSYYNRGLSKAKVRDMSGAISDLKKSLKLNKHNTQARNLLGLIYYELGEVVDALSEWVLSKHFQPENNELAEAYLDDIQASPSKIDNFNQSFKKYNLALQAAKQDNDDLAIIHLKKVITLNTHFLKAMQLLALEYIKIDEPDKAKKLLKRAKKMDISNNITLTYLDEVTISEENRDSDTVGIEDRTFNFPISSVSYREEKPNVMLYVNLIIGIVIGLCITSFLIVPQVNRKAAAKYNIATIDKSDDLSASELELDNAMSENANLQSKIEALTQEVESMKTQMSGIDCYNNLLSAAKLFIANDRENSAILLSEIDTSLFVSEDANVLYDYLKEQVYPETVRKLANEGKNLCNSGKMEEALVPLLKAYKMQSDDGVLYFLGRSYQKLGDSETAKIYFEELITLFPSTTRASTARKRLKEMGFSIDHLPTAVVTPTVEATPVPDGTDTGTTEADPNAGTNEQVQDAPTDAGTANNITDTPTENTTVDNVTDTPMENVTSPDTSTEVAQ